MRQLKTIKGLSGRKICDGNYGDHSFRENLEMYNALNFDAFVDFVLALREVFLHGGVVIVQVFPHTIVDKAYSAPDVVLVAVVACDLTFGDIWDLHVQLGWRTNRILSDEPSLTTTKNGHARGPTALSPAPNCAYYAMLFTKSHATTATSTTSGALYALSTIV
ncbi:hypothetical protein P5673_004409 [Acropora cervicornis]|uniref:Uncharacterized protein n=1 Tax=Acropora cervicornis TaxID=6130 RepID=A0AAD9R063_ACRCE|nr:hypothetical protein P5673_004409 [Acropora cervicornis]